MGIEKGTVQGFARFLDLVGQPLALPVGKIALAMDIIKTPWYIEVEVRQPNKIYQGGPSHEREGHK